MSEIATPHRQGLLAHQVLRHGSADDHARVDASFSHFDLGSPDSYGDFLQAHARVVPAIERCLTASVLPAWRPRSACLAADLAGLRLPIPQPIDAGTPDEAEQFGVLYVLEGSRLGGGLLARSVGPGLPHAYLAAVHLPNEWRSFLGTLDRRAAEAGPAWLDRVLAGAKHAFDLYARSAALSRPSALSGDCLRSAP